MNRYDCPNGYVIFKDGEPFQIGFRDLSVILKHGSDNLQSWLVTNNPVIPIEFMIFMLANFIGVWDYERVINIKG
jgi:hypothetical protein